MLLAILSDAMVDWPPASASDVQREKKEQKEREEAERKALLKVRRLLGAARG